MSDITEEEQIEAFKRWWAENGRSTLIAIVVALAGVFGYQAWQNHVQAQGEAASKIYQDLLDAVTVDSPMKPVDKEKVTTAKFLGKQLEDQYANTVYAHLGAMYMAKLAVDSGDLAEAAKDLKWSLDHGVNDTLKPIVTLRYARAELGLGKTDEALRVLDGVDDPGEYRPSFEELKGDAFHAMGDDEKAREAYQRAVNALGEAAGTRPILQMKLQDLQMPETNAPAAPKDAAAAPTGDAANGSGADASQNESTEMPTAASDSGK